MIALVDDDKPLNESTVVAGVGHVQEEDIYGALGQALGYFLRHLDRPENDLSGR